MAKLKELEAAMVAYFEQHRAQASDGLALLPGVRERRLRRCRPGSAARPQDNQRIGSFLTCMVTTLLTYRVTTPPRQQTPLCHQAGSAPRP